MAHRDSRRPGPLAGHLLNAAIFQVVWIACVAGGASGRWWLGPLAVLFFATWQIPRSANPRGELALIAIAALIGLVVDSSYLRAGLIAYPHPDPLAPLAPIWIVALWVGFALTLNHSLAWMQGRPLVSAVLGGASGAASFWFGAEVWGAAELIAPTGLVLCVLAVAWSILIPTLLVVAQRLQTRDSQHSRRPCRDLAIDARTPGAQ
jgi:hypothetical protein